MKIYIFGNGNLSFNEFLNHYILPVEHRVGCIDCKDNTEFFLCDFRGVDVLMMEYLKTRTTNVHVLHIGKKPRYLPDKFRTKVSEWYLLGGFGGDAERDDFAIQQCTHFLAHDINSDEQWKSGTQRNIERCLELGKKRIRGGNGGVL